VVPEEMQGLIVRSWSRVHGLVALEVFGHLSWSGLDIEALLATEVRAIAGEIGRRAPIRTATPRSAAALRRAAT